MLSVTEGVHSCARAHCRRMGDCVGSLEYVVRVSRTRIANDFIAVLTLQALWASMTFGGIHKYGRSLNLGA